MDLTKHAKTRIKERCGLGKKGSLRAAEKALTEGIPHSRTKGRLNKWITSLYFGGSKANNIRLYGDKAYIFHNQTLITVMQIPQNLMKDLKKMVKPK